MGRPTLRLARAGRLTVGSTRQWDIIRETVWASVRRRIRKGSDGRGSSSSPTRSRRTGGELRGWESIPGLRRSTVRCAATLAWTVSRLVPAASLGDTPIDGEDLLVLASSGDELAVLRRRFGSGLGRGEARMGGELDGVKIGGAGVLYL